MPSPRVVSELPVPVPSRVDLRTLAASSLLGAPRPSLRQPLPGAEAQPGKGRLRRVIEGQPWDGARRPLAGPVAPKHGGHQSPQGHKRLPAPAAGVLIQRVSAGCGHLQLACPEGQGLVSTRLLGVIRAALALPGL